MKGGVYRMLTPKARTGIGTNTAYGGGCTGQETRVVKLRYAPAVPVANISCTTKV